MAWDSSDPSVYSPGTWGNQPTPALAEASASVESYRTRVQDAGAYPRIPLSVQAGSFKAHPDPGFVFRYDFGGALQTGSVNATTGLANEVVANAFGFMEVEYGIFDIRVETVEGPVTTLEELERHFPPPTSRLSRNSPGPSPVPLPLSENGDGSFRYEHYVHAPGPAPSFSIPRPVFLGGIGVDGGQIPLLKSIEVEMVALDIVYYGVAPVPTSQHLGPEFDFRAHRVLDSVAEGSGEISGTWFLHNALGWVFDTGSGWQYSDSQQEWFWIDGQWGYTTSNGWHWLGEAGWIYRYDTAEWIYIEPAS